MSERRPALVRPGGGPSVWSLGGQFTVKLDYALAEGRFSLVEALAFRATEPPLHIHHREDEAWYILDGQMTFYVDDEAYTARSGAFVIAPMGRPHTFTVDVEPTRVLVFAAPSGFEHFALELGSPAVSDVPPAGLAMPGPEVLGRSRIATGSRWLAPHGGSRTRTEPNPPTHEARGPSPQVGGHSAERPRYLLISSEIVGVLAPEDPRRIRLDLGQKRVPCSCAW